MTSKKRHLPVLVFEIELILSQKQERSTKSSEKQQKAMETRPKNQNEQQRASKSNKEHFSFPFSFICFNLDLLKVVDIKSNEKPERTTTSNKRQQKATKGNERQRKAVKSNEEQQKAKTDNVAGKTKTGNKRHKKSKWKPGFILNVCLHVHVIEFNVMKCNAGITLTGYHPPPGTPGLLHQNMCPAPGLLHKRKCPGVGPRNDDVPGAGHLH